MLSHTFILYGLICMIKFKKITLFSTESNIELPLITNKIEFL